MIEWQFWWSNPFQFTNDKTCGMYQEDIPYCVRTLIIGPLQMRWYC